MSKVEGNSQTIRRWQETEPYSGRCSGIPMPRDTTTTYKQMILIVMILAMVILKAILKKLLYYFNIAIFEYESDNSLSI